MITKRALALTVRAKSATFSAVARKLAAIPKAWEEFGGIGSLEKIVERGRTYPSALRKTKGWLFGDTVCQSLFGVSSLCIGAHYPTKMLLPVVLVSSVITEPLHQTADVVVKVCSLMLMRKSEGDIFLAYNFGLRLTRR